MATIDTPKERFILILIKLLLFGLLLTGCAYSPPERDFADVDLLINVNDMPEGWAEAEFTENYPYSKEGAENLALRYFYFTSTTYLVKAGEDVYHYRNARAAYLGYKSIEDLYMTQRASDLTPWETPPEFVFSTALADRWRFACAYNSFAPSAEFGSRSRICRYLAQYEEFVVDFGVTMEVDGIIFITLEEITDVIETIDQTMGEYLQP